MEIKHYELSCNGDLVLSLLDYLGITKNWNDITELIHDELESKHGDENVSGQVCTLTLRLVEKGKRAKHGHYICIDGNCAYACELPIDSAELYLYSTPSTLYHSLRISMNIGDKKNPCLIPLFIELSNVGDAHRCVVSGNAVSEDNEIYLTAFLLRYQ